MKPTPLYNEYMLTILMWVITLKTALKTVFQAYLKTSLNKEPQNISTHL